MAKGSNLVKQAHRLLANPFFPKFQSNGLLAGSFLERVDLGFSIIFRHDMDGLDNELKLKRFLKLDDQLGVASTCFFEPAYVKQYPEMLRYLQNSRYEIQLHSRARPHFVFAFPPFQGIPKLIPLEGWLYARYKANLASQRKNFAGVVKATVVGHSPHAENNYLYFNAYMNWSIIERATVDSGFGYLSDWRLPSRVSENEEFPFPLPPRVHRNSSGLSCLVISTAWDDKFLFSSFEDRVIWHSIQGKYSRASHEEALSSIQRKLQICQKNNMPFAINLHPRHFFDENVKSFRIKERLVAWALENNVPIKTFGQIWNEWKTAKANR